MIFTVMLFVVLLSLVFCLAILRWERKLPVTAILREDLCARQASHVGNPLRLGGVAVLAGLTVGIGAAELTGAATSAHLLLLSVLPVLVAGLAEDLGHRVSPRGRFLAAIFSAIAAMALLGAWAPRADMPGLDWLMSWSLVSMALTVIFSAGFCHAVNLIDGMNGLAASVVTVAALGCATIAMRASQPEITTFASLLTAAVVGFLFVNWPVARLFLGDAGAYGLGHLLVWLMILLSWHSNEVAVPALMLVLFWPIADVLHTILRRVAARVSILHPDRMHLHQKVRRMLDIVRFGYNRRQRSNPLTTLVLFPLICAPVVTGVLLWNRPVAAWIALGAFLLAFAAAHSLVFRLALRFRR